MGSDDFRGVLAVIAGFTILFFLANRCEKVHEAERNRRWDLEHELKKTHECVPRKKPKEV